MTSGSGGYYFLLATLGLPPTDNNIVSRIEENYPVAKPHTRGEEEGRVAATVKEAIDNPPAKLPPPPPAPGRPEFRLAGFVLVRRPPASQPASAPVSRSATDLLEDAIERARLEVAGKRGEFIRSVRFLRELGVSFEPSVLVSMSGEPDINWTCMGVCFSSEYDEMRDVLRKASGYGREFSLADDKYPPLLGMLGKFSPELVIGHHATPLLEAGKIFADTSQEIKLPFITMHVDVKDGYYRVVLWNWIENAPFYTRICPLDTVNASTGDAIALDLRAAVKRELQLYDMAVAVRRLPPLSGIEKQEMASLEVYRFNRPTGWTERDVQQSRRSLGKILKTFKVIFQGRKYQSEIDRDASHPVIYKPLQLELTSAKMPQVGDEALEINGFLDAIRLEVPNEDLMFELAKDPKFAWDGKEIIRDKYGNVIIPLVGIHGLSGRKVFGGFIIIPAYRLASSAAATQVETLGVDLSRFGLGDHPRLLTTRSFPPTKMPDETNPYALYSTLPPQDRAQETGIFGLASKMAAETERFFGFTPGERIKHVFLTPASSWNASVRFANLQTFFLWDDIFGDLRSGKADFVVPHEVYHNFDAQFGFSLHEGFLDMFAKLTSAADSELFFAVNEKAMLDVNKGGHSSDNVFEFFASLVNSIRASKWKEKVEKMSPRVRALYWHALTRLRLALVARHPAITGAPIFALLSARIKALGVGHPPLESLIPKPANRLLAEGPNRLQVIKAREFEREVIESFEPVVVIIFSEDSRESVAEIQKMATALRSKAKVVAISMQEASFVSDKYFKGSYGTLMPYVFSRGKLVFEPRGVTDIEDRIKKASAALDPLQRSPIPIFGPLIDLIQKRRQ